MTSMNEMENTGLFLAVVGLIFVIIGSILFASMKNSKRYILTKLKILIFIGILLVIGGVSTQFKLLNLTAILHSVDENFWKTMSRYIMLVFAAGFAILAIFISLDLFKNLITCRNKYYAICVDIKSRSSSHSDVSTHGSHLVYCPIYKINTPQGEVRICNDSFSNFHVPVIGEKYQLRVDAKDVNHFYDLRTIKSQVSMIVMSTLFFLVICQVYVTITN